MTLPQLPREPIYPNLPNGEVDREIWQPRWNCYCCHDTGLVRRILILLVIPNYDHHHDKPVACQRRGCEASFDYRLSPYYDQRFDSSICAELDKISRDDWKRTILDQHQLAKNRAAVKEASGATSLRLRDRTPEEDLYAQRRAEEVKAEQEKLFSQHCTEEENII